MLFLQKLISNLFLSPMLLILILFGLSFVSYRKKIKQSTLSKIFIVIASTLYIFSIEPIKDIIVKPLENMYTPINKEELKKGDVYVVLGSGILENAPLSLNSKGIPTETALTRIIEVVRLYKKSPKKIIVSGGIVFDGEKTEAETYKKIMVDLGVLEEDIILEGRSRTTGENAKFTSEIIEKFGYKKVILITSATHMKRGIESFLHEKVEVIPAPCDYLVKYQKYGIGSFEPQLSNLEYIRRALWEYIGYVYYKIIL